MFFAIFGCGCSATNVNCDEMAGVKVTANFVVRLMSFAQMYL